MLGLGPTDRSSLCSLSPIEPIMGGWVRGQRRRRPRRCGSVACRRVWKVPDGAVGAVCDRQHGTHVTIAAVDLIGAGLQGPTLYSFSISFQVVLPFAARVPRYAFSILGTAVLIPLAIVGSTRFEETLVDL
jgi:hypothetical protein